MTKLFLPSSGPISWQTFLADPEKQWRTGYSARTLAYAWEAANGRFPPEIEHVFSQSNDKRVDKLEVLLAFPEWKVYLPPKGHPSQNDLFVLAKGTQGLVSIMVEGKVAEPFGKTLEGWLKTQTKGKLQRLEFLQSRLGISGEVPKTIRYQLLHRAVSAIMEADRFGAKSAVMLVHSFSPECLWFEDFRAFLTLFGVNADQTGKLYHLSEVGGLALFAGWATGSPEYLKS